jgi:hypothetical protein
LEAVNESKLKSDECSEQTSSCTKDKRAEVKAELIKYKLVDEDEGDNAL